MLHQFLIFSGCFLWTLIFIIVCEAEVELRGGGQLKKSTWLCIAALVAAVVFLLVR